MLDRSIIIPAWNEARRLGPTLARVQEFCAGAGASTEVIVADDGSEDGTAEIATRAGVRVVRLDHHRGKGAAVRAGVAAATGARVCFVDADLSAPIEALPAMEAALAQADLVIASRALPTSDIAVPQPRWREQLGRAFNVYVRHTLGVHDWQDTQCGLKLFTADAARRAVLPGRVDGFAFDVEVLLAARALGMRVVEVPIVWRDDPDTRVSLLRAAPRMAWDVLRLRGARARSG